MSFARRLKRQQSSLLSHGVRSTRTLARRGATCGVAAIVAVSAIAPAIASVGNDELELDVQGAQLMSRAELDENRGGFAIGAFKLDIGVKITTTINNNLALQSVLSMNAKNTASKITSSVFKGQDAAAQAAQNAGKGGLNVAAGAAAAAKAAALGVAIPQIQVATKIPQVVTGAVAGDSGESAKGSQSLPIPVAGEIIQQVQDAVEPTVGNLIPSQTAPNGQTDPEPHVVVTTPQQLAEVILDGTPSAEQANNAGAILAQEVVDALGTNTGAAVPTGNQEIAQIVETAGPTEPPASAPTIAQDVPALVVDTASIATALADIVTEAGPQAPAAPAEAQTPAAPQELALNDVEVIPEVIMTALAGGTKFDVGDTEVTHQIQNGILASIQNSANGLSVAQTVEMSVNITNFNSVIQGAMSNMKAAMMGGEVAKFSSTLGN